MPSQDWTELLSDRYRIDRQIAAGGMATVYLAHDLKHGRAVAIKVMKPEIAASIGRERFLREIQIAARLAHPHILPLHDSGDVAGQLYYVTPYVPGETLRARLRRETQLPLEEALRLTREIASALGYAHRQGVVHRDIKPENILLADEIALVADFGIARALEGWAGDGETMVSTGGAAVLGTPQYMSPEQARGAEVDARTDLYALACVCYEMLSGQPPFVATSAQAVIRQHLNADPAPLHERCRAVPERLSNAIAKGLSKSPEDRYASAAKFVDGIGLASSEANGDRAPGSHAIHNLPPQRTSFVGRERELDECARLLEEGRLLTLTGIGGSGKTRVALQLGERSRSRYPDGVWFIDLAPLAEEGRVIETVASTLGVREESGDSLTSGIARHVASRRILLILDNCEHLIEAAGRTADSLLNAGPGLQLLVTSREGLGVPGERLYAIQSLEVPSAIAAADPRAVESSEAARLFADRARAVLPEFTLNQGNAAAVAEICRRLDGIPLAIELAAARMKLLSVDQIRAKLDDRFRLLTGGSKTALPRHQTLRATIQWSYDQLAPEEQRLLRRLSVFSGGWTLDMATRIAGDEGSEFESMDGLARLVDKSLVVVDRESNLDPRYRLLEIVRQYAQERLSESGEADSIRRRHLDRFRDLAMRAHEERLVSEETWSPLLEAEHDNLRAALAYARDVDPERRLELAGELSWFWLVRSHFREGLEQLTSALAEAASRAPRPSLARALSGAASIAALRGDGAAAVVQMKEALSMWRQLGDRRAEAMALEGLSMAYYLAGDERSARDASEEELALLIEIGDPVLVNRARVTLGQMLIALGDVEATRVQASEILAFALPRGDKRSEFLAMHYLADCCLSEEKFAESLTRYRRSLELASALGDRLETTFEIQGVAMSFAGLGEHERALRLGGAVEAERERIGAEVRIPFWDRFLDTHLGRAREALGPERARRAWEDGRSMPMADAVRNALDVELSNN